LYRGITIGIQLLTYKQPPVLNQTVGMKSNRTH